MILTLKTSEITTHRSDGEGGGPWKEMKDGLLFYGIHIEGDGATKDKGIKLSIPVLTYSADASLRRRDDAPMVAKGTVNLPSF
jgi:hypothetical protein